MNHNSRPKSGIPYVFLGAMLGVSFLIFAGTIFWIYTTTKTAGDGDILVKEEFVPTTSTITTTEPANADTPLPEKAYVKVPFTTQAPKANWDEIHEETCEEASLIMMKHFLEGSTFGSTDQADQELLSLVDWETQNGYLVDVTLSQLNEIAKNHFGIRNGTVKTGISADDIKRELAAGHPVIVGAAGKILPNPNFRNGGPVYHMLVVVGYDKEGFITHDPGTRKGENFRYTVDGLYNAIHDWNASDIMAGGKNYLVFK